MNDILSAPLEKVREIAPRSVVWAPGGTRRQAAIEGVPVDKDYFRWAWAKQKACIENLFQIGIQTLFVPILGPPQVREVGPYRERLTTEMATLAHQDSLDFYEKLGVRVRFYGHQHLPTLTQLFADVEKQTRGNGPHTLWWTMVVENENEAQWDAIQAAQHAGATSFDQAVQAFYGEPMVPVDVFISFGKLSAGYLLPPLISEQAAFYWTAFPSYMLNESHLRAIIADYHFARSTWNADKSQRYQGTALEELIKRYQEEKIIGVGERIGTFWHPR